MDRRRRRRRRLPAPRAAPARTAAGTGRGTPTAQPPARHDALAADHACLVDAFTRLAEATGEARWIDEALAVADTLLDHFWDIDHGGLFTTPDDGEALVARQKDLFDNATPSANSTAAVALYRLAALTGEARYANHADRILQLIGAVIDQAPAAFSHALAAAALHERRHHRGRRRRRPARPRGRRQRDAGVPTSCWPGASRYDSPLWDGRVDGLAYVCRALRLPGARRTPPTACAPNSAERRRLPPAARTVR